MHLYNKSNNTITLKWLRFLFALNVSPFPNLHLGLGLSGSLEIVDLSVDTVSTLSNESFVVVAAEEDITSETILVRCLSVGVNSEDWASLLNSHNNSLLVGRLNLLWCHLVGNERCNDRWGKIDNDNLIMMIVVDFDGLVAGAAIAGIAWAALSRLGAWAAIRRVA